MEYIKLGEKDTTKNYDFRETCFGICERDNKILLVKKNGEYSLVGGGIEPNESKSDCLKREYEEESGYIVKGIKDLCVVDCHWLAAKGKFPLRSLANIFIVDLEEDFGSPLEENHFPEWVDKSKVLDCLVLPYQIEGFKFYLKKSIGGEYEGNRF